ncbi:sensor histidine kinase [Nocardioides jensenii]|uniref:sensor histidine kinase n=1 Tax=Nocardioides jensenii TaxID=1843 RepID=UPI0008317730|nr:HAMP domain-containing sensor histidine kinase [Nocardioides jensenii]
MPPLVAVVLLDHDHPRLQTASAVASLDFNLVLAASGFLLYSRWRIGGDAPSGWLAATLVGLALGSVPFAIVDMTDVQHRSGSTGDFMGTVLALPFVVMLVLCTRGTEFRGRLHPLGVGVATGLMLLGGRLVAVGVLHEPLLRLPRPAGAITAIALVLVFVVTLDVLHRRRPGTDPLTRFEFTIVSCGVVTFLLLGSVGTVGGTLQSWTSVVVLVVLAGLVVLSTTEALLHTLSQQVPGVTASSAVLAEDEELFHELRSTVADISTATQILLGDDVRLSPSSRRRLAAGLTSEVARLQRLVGRSTGTEAARVSLDQVITPLVTCQRALGHDIRWEPSGHQVRGRQDDVSEIVHILLHNSLRHAPGTTITLSVRRCDSMVELRVSDGGPGIPPALRDSLFQRGVRGPSSPGSGLGLYLARQLAGQQGGNLQLRHNDGVRGASFVVTLPNFGGEDS